MSKFLPAPRSILPVSVTHKCCEIWFQSNFLVNKVVDAERWDVISRAGVVLDGNFSVLIGSPVDIFAHLRLRMKELTLMRDAKESFGMMHCSFDKIDVRL